MKGDVEILSNFNNHQTIMQTSISKWLWVNTRDPNIAPHHPTRAVDNHIPSLYAFGRRAGPIFEFTARTQNACSSELHPESTSDNTLRQCAPLIMKQLDILLNDTT